jgi:glutamine amidotransferase
LGGFFSEELIEEIRLANDIVNVISEYVVLKKKGRNYSGLCPFHSEKTPSFMVSPDKQIFHCFGCGAGGNVLSFVMKKENLTFPEAMRMLAEKAGISLPEAENNAGSARSKARERAFEINNLTKESILEEIDLSLQRLNVDHVDLLQMHWPDHNTPIEESMEALYSLVKAGKIRYIGASNFSAELIEEADGVILPGVGAFADAMHALERSGLIPSIIKTAESGKPLLGICLGMQALLAGSEEGTGVSGLGLIPGYVRRFPDCGLKIPHIGWNSLDIVKKSPLFSGLPSDAYTYFVHSFACMADNEDDVLAVTQYGVPFHSAIQRGNVMGVQFHPEKSGRVGQIIIKNFAAMSSSSGREVI